MNAMFSYERDVLVGDTRVAKLVGYGEHDAGLSAAPHPGDDLYHPLVMVEAADAAEILLATVHLHDGLPSSESILAI